LFGNSGVYTHDEVARVLDHRARGASIAAIAREVGVSRSTVRSWLDGVPAWLSRPAGAACPDCIVRRGAADRYDIYAYLLGIYLGDGCISEGPRADRMRVTLDACYPGIIEETRVAIAAISRRRSNVLSRGGWVEVYGESQHWKCVFPQAGPGPKHKRAIVLEPWQRDLVERAPEPLIRGLIHSDGCRIVHTVAGHRYVRYFLSNKSTDIHRIFRDACDQLGIKWTASRIDHTSIARREAIAAMDRFVGPKQ
jgi:hypothetical protein